jgi:hypothetical protein
MSCPRARVRTRSGQHSGTPFSRSRPRTPRPTPDEDSQILVIPPIRIGYSFGMVPPDRLVGMCGIIGDGQPAWLVKREGQGPKALEVTSLGPASMNYSHLRRCVSWQNGTVALPFSTGMSTTTPACRTSYRATSESSLPARGELDVVSAVDVVC